MKRTGKYRLVLALAGTLLVLLPLLAMLQYRWLAQLSQSETVRMQTNLDAALGRVSGEIGRDVFQAARMFFLRSPVDDQEVASELAFRFDQWQSVARYPRLLKTVYWVGVASDDDSARIARLDRELGILNPVEWPAELNFWRQTFTGPDDTTRTSTTSFGEMEAHQAPPVFQVPVLGESDTKDGELDPDPLAGGRRPVTNSILLVYDEDVITKTIVPALVQTYFGGGASLDYDILLVDESNPDNALYRSSPELTASDFKRPDATVHLGLPDRPWPDPDSDTLMTWIASFPDRRQAEGRNLRERGAGLTQYPVGRHARARQPGLWRPIQNPRFPRWLMLARHKGGSLEQAVAWTRWRNLAVSFGVLLLLGGAIGLILLFVRQMQRLADQQMAFVAGVSHELRTPVAVIHSAGENLRDGLIDNPGETRDYGALIVRESQRLLGMVEHVLTFSGIAFGQRAFADEPVRVDHVLEKAIEMVEPVLIETGISLDRQIDSNLPTLRGDSAALVAAVQNLLQNAVKYGEEQRWIGLEARLDGQDRDRHVLISVSDRGNGIPPAEQARIFEPFYRSSHAIGSNIRGNGLGLSIVKNIVEAHGGSIKVDSTPGLGSRFTIRLRAGDLHDGPAHESRTVES